MKRVLPFAVLALVLFGAIYLWGRDPGQGPALKSSTQKLSASSSYGGSVIDLDNALAVALPKPSATLKPVDFKTPDGKNGWVVKFPGAMGFDGALPLSTPAYDNGKLYLGGGFGSTQFYSIDAQTGEMIWHEPTSDDGPTPPSTDGQGNIAFNTQSCSLMVMDENNGTIRWKEWLGDPLVSQPTISKGKVYASFPNDGASSSVLSVIDTPSLTAAMIQTQSPDAATAEQRQVSGYCLLCADVKHGRHLWKKGIPQEVISAPIVVGSRMYFACYDGTVECLNAGTGATIWSRALDATSAPVVAHGRVVVTVREDRQDGPYEGILRLDAATGRSLDLRPLALTPALYLANDSGGCVAIDSAQQKSLDSYEGFPDGLPSPDNIPTSVQVGSAGDPFGIDTVTGAWSYQGSRVAIASNRIFDAQGIYVNGLRESDGKKLWRMKTVGQNVSSDMQIFSPPALGAKDLYLCSGRGDLVSLAQSNGQVQFAYKLGQPIAFQPILAGGNIYIATANGLLICIKTGSHDASGWGAWGGDGLHNKAN